MNNTKFLEEMFRRIIQEQESISAPFGRYRRKHGKRFVIKTWLYKRS